MLKRSVRIELEKSLHDMQINLENNYKDLAHDALRELHEKLEGFHNDGFMKDKDYLKYKKIADDYSMRLQNYHH